MPDEVQIIRQDGKPAFAVVPIELWQRMQALAEDATDVAAAEAVLARVRAGEEEVFPQEVVDEMLQGSPIKAFRRHRGLTQAELAGMAECEPVYLSQIETGRRKPSLDLLKRISAALAVDLDLLA